MLRVTAAAICVVTTMGHALADAPARGDDRQKRTAATRTELIPRIDGKLDDEAWRAAAVDDRFTQNFPDEARPPSERTELRVLYDDRAIYIGVRCFDSHPERIVERLTRRDRDNDAEKVSVAISSKNDRLTSYEFVVNVSGVLQDVVHFNDTDSSLDWDGLWLGAAARDAHGWSAEYMIPLKTLRYEGSRTEFGFQVRRLIQRRQEIDEWAYTPRAAKGDVSYYGVLDGLAGLHAARLFQLMPYLASGIYLRYGQDPSDLNGVQLYGSLGGDLKLGLTPALTLDATINPDFGQVEADQVILNLTTFELFYPEKRPFFLEGVDVFATPLQLFYSRRIGRQPPAPDSNTFVLHESQSPGRIYAAAKVSGLVARRLTIGALDAITAESTSLVTRLNASAAQQPFRLVTLPMTNFAVLRLKREFLARSYVGMMATATTRFERPFAAAPNPDLGDTCPDTYAPSPRGRCFADGYTAATDFNLRTADGSWGAAGQVAGSLRGPGPRRTLVDGTPLGPGTTGVGMALDGGKSNGKYIAQLGYRGYSPGFDDNALGYNQSSNQHIIHPWGRYRILKPYSIIQEGAIELSQFIRQSWDFRRTLEHVYWLGFNLRFRNFWSTYFEMDWFTNSWDLREARDGTAVERARGWFAFFYLKTDPRKKIWAQAQGATFKKLHGVNAEWSFQIALRPKPAIEIDILPHFLYSYGDPRWFDTRSNGDGTNTYYFADLDSREFDVTLRGTYTFLPTLSLQAYAQLFVAGEHYGKTVTGVASGPGSSLALDGWRPALMPRDDAPDVRQGALNVNVLLRWEFIPGSTLLAVYTHAQTQPKFDPTIGFGRPSFSAFANGPATDLFLLKLSLLLS